MASLLDKISAEMKRGIIQIATLSILRERMYGYQLVKILGAAGLDTEEGTLYPLLRRLESQGLLLSQWDTAGKRPRKYYRLSPEGFDTLAQLETVWSEISTSIGSILKTPSSTPSVAVNTND